MDNFFSLIDILAAVIGAYACYSWIVMKTKGEIKTTLLLNNDIDIKKCNDREAYIKYINIKLLVFGISALIYGAIGIVNSYVTDLGHIFSVALVVFLCIIVWYCVVSRKSLKMFWDM